MATSVYVGDIEVRPGNERRARNIADQKKLDAYWRKHGPKQKSNPKEAAIAAASKNPTVMALKFKLALICFGIIALVCLVVFIYLGNVYVDPTYLNVGIYLNKSYSRESTAKIIQVEKEYQNTLDTVAKTNQDNWSEHSFDPSTYKGNGKLDPARFTTSKGYIENFAEINNDLLAYVSSISSFTVDGVSFDGLAYLAMCNDESANWVRDTTQTVSSAFPSALIDVDTTNYLGQFEKLNIGDIFTSPKAYNLTGGNFYLGSAWIMNGGSDSDQGPTTSAFNEYDHGNVVSGLASEASIVTNRKAEIDAISKEPMISARILETCTGSGHVYGASIIANSGDRWSIHDSAAVFTANMEKYLPMYTKEYTKLFSTTPGKYELLCFMQMQHWFGSGFTLFNKQADDFNKIGAWPLLIKGICDESSLAIIQEEVEKELSQNDCLCHANKDSEFVFAVLENINSLGLQYSDGSTFDYTTDIRTDQGRSEFINFVYNYMLLEKIYSEGSTSE